MDDPQVLNNTQKPPIRGPSRLYRIIRWICVASMALQVMIVVYVVFGRFVLNNTPKWGEEVALLAMVWLSLFSAALAMEDDSHIRMRIFDKLFAKKGIVVRDIVFFILNTLLCVFLIVEGVKLVLLTKASIMPGSRLPVPVLYISVPISAVGYMYILSINFVKQVKTWIKTLSQ